MRIDDRLCLHYHLLRELIHKMFQQNSTYCHHSPHIWGKSRRGPEHSITAIHASTSSFLGIPHETVFISPLRDQTDFNGQVPQHCTSQVKLDINLSSKAFNDVELHVPSLELSFCPSSNLDLFETIKDLNLFACNLILRVLYDKKPIPSAEEIFGQDLTIHEFRYLEALAAESNLLDLIDTIDLETILDEVGKTPKPKKKSSTFPHLNLNPNINAFVLQVTKKLETLHLSTREVNNLTHKNKLALSKLKNWTI